MDGCMDTGTLPNIRNRSMQNVSSWYFGEYGPGYGMLFRLFSAIRSYSQLFAAVLGQECLVDFLLKVFLIFGSVPVDDSRFPGQVDSTPRCTSGWVTLPRCDPSNTVLMRRSSRRERRRVQNFVVFSWLGFRVLEGFQTYIHTKQTGWGKVSAQPFSSQTNGTV